MLQDRESQQTGHQDQPNGVGARDFGRERLQHDEHIDDGGQGDGDRKQQIHRAFDHVGLEIAQRLGQPVLVQIRHAEEQIELGAPAHDPEHDEGPGADLVRLAPGGQHHEQHGTEDQELVIETGEDRQSEAPPLRAARRAGRLARPRDQAGEVAHLDHAPDHHTGGEGDIGAGHAGRGAAHDQDEDGDGQDDRSAHERPAEGASGQIVEIEHDPRTEPPESEREQEWETVISHALNCVSEVVGVEACRIAENGPMTGRW